MSGRGTKNEYYPPGYDYAQGQNPMDPGFSYDFGTQEFGTQPQFQQFDYNNPPKSGPVPPQPSYPVTSSPYFPQQSPYPGSILTPDTSSFNSNPTDAFEDELPLMEELGINFDHILQKTIAVLNPFKQTDASILQETDLAGPLVFCLTFGAFLLLSGKVHFGYIYGIGVLSCIAMYVLLNLMSESGVSIGCIISVLGYCLLPMVVLSGVSVLSLRSIVGTVLSVLAVLWCSLSASKLFVTALAMDHQQPLVAYPCALLYGVFALLTVF